MRSTEDAPRKAGDICVLPRKDFIGLYKTLTSGLNPIPPPQGIFLPLLKVIQPVSFLHTPFRITAL